MNYLKPSIKSFSEAELQNEIVASASGFWSGGPSGQGGSATYTYSDGGGTSYSGGVSASGGEGHVTGQVSSGDVKAGVDYNANKSSWDATAEYKFNDSVTGKAGVNSDGVANVGAEYKVNENISLNGNVNSQGDYSVGVKYSVKF